MALAAAWAGRHGGATLRPGGESGNLLYYIQAGADRRPAHARSGRLAGRQVLG